MSEGVAVAAGRREAILDADIKVIYGFSIPETAAKVRRNVAGSLFGLCGLTVKEVNVRISGIEFPDTPMARWSTGT